MKKVIPVIIGLMLFIPICRSQSLFSDEYLSEASEEELSLLLTKAENQKKTGTVITLVGTGMFFTGAVLIFSNREAAGYAGFYISLAALPVTLIGVPTLISGSSKVRAVSKAWNKKFNPAVLNVSPCLISDLQTNNFMPGLQLEITF